MMRLCACAQHSTHIPRMQCVAQRMFDLLFVHLQFARRATRGAIICVTDRTRILNIYRTKHYAASLHVS